MCYWHKFLENVISDIKNKGYIFNLIAEMIIRTIGKKLDMSYEF